MKKTKNDLHMQITEQMRNTLIGKIDAELLKTAIEHDLKIAEQHLKAHKQAQRYMHFWCIVGLILAVIMFWKISFLVPSLFCTAVGLSYAGLSLRRLTQTKHSLTSVATWADMLGMNKAEVERMVRKILQSSIDN